MSTSSSGISFPSAEVNGYPTNRWFEVELDVDGINNIATLSIGGVVIDTFTFTGSSNAGDLLLGGADLFNSANPANYILFDNIVVTPEPTTLALLAFGALIARRR